MPFLINEWVVVIQAFIAIQCQWHPGWHVIIYSFLTGTVIVFFSFSSHCFNSFLFFCKVILHKKRDVKYRTNSTHSASFINDWRRYWIRQLHPQGCQATVGNYVYMCVFFFVFRKIVTNPCWNFVKIIQDGPFSEPWQQGPVRGWQKTFCLRLYWIFWLPEGTIHPLVPLQQHHLQLRHLNFFCFLQWVLMKFFSLLF